MTGAGRASAGRGSAGLGRTARRAAAGFGAAAALAALILAACSRDPVLEAFEDGTAAENALSAMELLVADGQAAGAVATAAQGGDVLFLEAAGVQDLETRAPMRPDSIFAIASMTKPVTAAAMMMLWEDGLWDLDDPVADYLPELADPRVLTADGGTRPADSPITMAQLMSHSAGLAYEMAEALDDARYGGSGLVEQSASLDDLVARVAALPLAHEPGAGFSYGFASDLQGAIIERLSGQTLPDFLQDRIFGPLGMADTGFAVPADKRGRLAAIYERTEAGLRKRPIAAPESPPAAPSGGAGLYSTAPDYLKFARMLAGGGALDGVRLLQPETVALMRAPALDEGVNGGGYIGEGSRVGYGLGVAVIREPSRRDPRAVGTFYWEGTYSTYFWIDPESDLTAVALTQIKRRPDEPQWEHPDTSPLMRAAIYSGLAAESRD